jgi:hypothetical protein
LAGFEKLLALNGQHQLVGIKEALSQNSRIGDDGMSVVYAVPNAASGIARPRLTENASAISEKRVRIFGLEFVAKLRPAHQSKRKAMPQRSNDFQKLVYLIQEQLRDRPDTIVIESKMLVDRNTGKPREVDIAIETSANGIPFVVAFECRDRSRNPDIGWVEQLIAKHEHLSDKLVLVANRAFTPDAVDKAKRHGVETVELSAATKQNWPALLDQYTSLVFATFDLKIKTFTVEYDYPNDAQLSRDAPLDVVDKNGGRAPIAKFADLLIAHREGCGTPVMDLWFAKPLAERCNQHEVTLQFVPPADEPMCQRRLKTDPLH